MTFRKTQLISILLGIVALNLIALFAFRTIESREAAHQSRTMGRLKQISFACKNFREVTGSSLFDRASELNLSWRVMLAKSFDEDGCTFTDVDFTESKFEEFQKQTTHEFFVHPSEPELNDDLTNFRAVKFPEVYVDQNKTSHYWIMTYIPSMSDVWTSKNILSQKEFEAEIAKPDSQTKFIVTEDQQVMTVKDFFELKRSVQN